MAVRVIRVRDVFGHRFFFLFIRGFGCTLKNYERQLRRVYRLHGLLSQLDGVPSVLGGYLGFAGPSNSTSYRGSSKGYRSSVARISSGLRSQLRRSKWGLKLPYQLGRGLVNVFGFFSNTLLLVVYLRRRVSTVSLFRLSISVSRVFLLLTRVFLQVFSGGQGRSNECQGGRG